MAPVLYVGEPSREKGRFISDKFDMQGFPDLAPSFEISSRWDSNGNHRVTPTPSISTIYDGFSESLSTKLRPMPQSNGVNDDNNSNSNSSCSDPEEPPIHENGCAEQQQLEDQGLCSMSTLAHHLPPLPPAPVSMLHRSHEQKLVDLMDKTRYNIVQRNGQRIFGGPPPDWTGPPPPKGSEIFVGKVPRDCFEEELVPIFQRVGQIYELRLMMDFSGSNRGYLFVRYTCREDAKKAVREFNNYEIRDGKFLGVLHSVDNRKLYISGIPKNRSAAEIKSDMQKITAGVRDVILYPSQADRSKTRGYAFVEYETHRAAALARRKLVPSRTFLLGQEIDKVDWAEPEYEVDEETMAKVKILFIRNLLPHTTESKIRRVFDDFSGGQVERVKKTKDYAFVHFASRESAELAMRECEGLMLDGSVIEVTWSKPVDKQIYNTRKQLTKALSSPTGVAMLEPPQPIQPPTMPYIPPSGPNGFGSGAPGTCPPRGLVRKLVAASNGDGPISNMDHQFKNKNNLYSQQLIQELCNSQFYQQLEHGGDAFYHNQTGLPTTAYGCNPLSMAAFAQAALAMQPQFYLGQQQPHQQQQQQFSTMYGAASQTVAANNNQTTKNMML